MSNVPLTLMFQIDKYDDPSDVTDALVLGPFLAGTLPWSRSLRLHRVKPDAPLLPPGTVPTRAARGRDFDTVVAEGDGWMMQVSRWRDGTADVVVVAVDETVGNAIFEQATHDATEPEVEDDSTVDVGFWHMGHDGGQRRVRNITAASWPEIERNYPARARAAIGQLMSVTAADVAGRLVLLHGPPGTGKTTALRALAYSWRKWCTLEYVLDPERLLGEPPYLMRVALGDDRDDDDRWRLLLLEDCDELIRVDAKRGSGQSLARLLNLTDGLLGQGLEVIVAITTNEPLTRLHPAIVRPGRCLAHIEVGRFNRSEAIDWLGSPANIDPEGVTLADLFMLRGELEKVDNVRSDGPVGLYL